MRAVGLLCIVIVAGCSGNSFDISPSLDDSAADSASVDDATTDSSADTTAATTDSTVDTTSEGDSRPPPDSAADTRMPDAPMCPAPRSTKSHEVTTTDCAMLREQYGKAVNAAKICNCDEECTDKLDSNLCSCETYANPARNEYLLALAIEDKFRMAGCVPTCGPLCKAPLSAKCVPFGTVKVCADRF